jgi:large subunit ribosomal protein L22
MKAILKNSRISPKKANLIAKMVRGKTANSALDFLKVVPKKAAKILAKILRSAIANAENNFQKNSSDLKVEKVLVLKGRTLKRGVPASRGRVAPIKKRASNIFVELTAEENSKKSNTEKVSKKNSKK